MNLLKITNSYSYFVSNNNEVKEILHKALRFRDRNYFHNRRYKMGLWDGFVDFFKKDSGKFLTGLLPEVQFVLNHKKIPYEIVDNRKNVNFINHTVNENFLSNDIKLRDYQTEYIELVAKYRRGIIDAKTGAGKTLIMSGIVKNLPVGTKILILCNRKTLVEQNYNELIKYGIDNVGRVYDKYKEPNTITCSTIQCYNHIEHLLSGIDVLIVDELHLLSTGKAKKLYAKLNNCSIRVGMSATPFKFGGKDACQKYTVKGWIGPVIKLEKSSEKGILTAQELEGRNILSTASCSFININEPLIPHEIYLDAVTKGIAQNTYLNNTVKKLATGLNGRTLILVDRIEHGDALKKLIPESYWIQGKDDMESRKFVIDQLTHEGNAIGIATAGILSVGVNIFCHNMINCSDANAEHILLQALGRGLRIKNDKSHLNYYDFMFNINPYLNEHAKSRVKILQKYGYEVSVIDY